ncbi:WD repeat-containing protein 20-like [Chenopodium quinoa]|uniref:WD repeat-containing protein 20-like n=1 Tax=Chenopodium quinoa TaxID=63459 RepID=UPI000B796D01|nr:WD repeat-containing protein 20-like [Chenopodium quinoa]
MSNSSTTTTNSATVNGGISSPATAGLKAYFKTPEGRYTLHSEKSHPSTLLHYSHGKTVSQVTLANLKEKIASSTPTSSSGYSASSSVRSAAAKLLGSNNGGRALSFVGGNGANKAVAAATKTATFGSSSNGSSSPITSFDGKGMYIIYNVGDTLYISDLNSQEKDPIKSIHFASSNPVCHTFNPEAKDGHDLLIGLNSGDVYTVSLRQQLQDIGKKLVGAHHYNKDGSINNSRCTSVAWVPQVNGFFVVAHADGNVYVYEKGKDATVDSSFPLIKDPTQFSIAHAKSSKSNPISRWHICQGSINRMAFSVDGTHLAVVGRDGFLRVFDYQKELLVCGGKSYYGAILCCAWSMDGKYILTGGEDDLVQVWSMEDRKVIAWGEGHNSWVSGVAFDPYWSPPSSDSTGENVMYRFGSVGQDTQLLLWDFSMDEIVVPLRRCPPGGSPTYSAGSQSAQWDSVVPLGSLQPAPSMRDVPKLSPLVAHRVYTDPLSDLVFTQHSILTACREGHVKVWKRPGSSETILGDSETANAIEKHPIPSASGSDCK